jgi:hypothetical protein
MASQYEASRDSFEQIGEAAGWSFPLESLPNSAQSFVQGLDTLAQYHPKMLDNLVAVIMPAAVLHSLLSGLLALVERELPDRAMLKARRLYEAVIRYRLEDGDSLSIIAEKYLDGAK